MRATTERRSTPQLESRSISSSLGHALLIGETCPSTMFHRCNFRPTDLDRLFEAAKEASLPSSEWRAGQNFEVCDGTTRKCIDRAWLLTCYAIASDVFITLHHFFVLVPRTGAAHPNNQPVLYRLVKMCALFDLTSCVHKRLELFESRSEICVDATAVDFMVDDLLKSSLHSFEFA